MKVKERRLRKKPATEKTSPGFEPERKIKALIRSGAFASAGRNAIIASFDKGLPVTVMENNVIYRIHPDGKRIAIKKIAPLKHTYTSGKISIK